MANRSKALGTRWESQVVSYLIEQGWPHAERRALSGNQDRGDIAGLAGVVVECKAVSRLQLAEWAKETAAEVANAGARVGFVWIKRRGKTSPADGYVLMDGRTATYLLKEAGY